MTESKRAAQLIKSVVMTHQMTEVCTKLLLNQLQEFENKKILWKKIAHREIVSKVNFKRFSAF